MHDRLHTFLFEHAPVRGALAQLGPAWTTVRGLRTYPPVLERLLGEAMAAAALLATTVKFPGSLLMQMQGSGPLTLLAAECTHDLRMRAVARWRADLPDQAAPHALLGDGRCALTLKGDDGRPVYQGVVPVEGETLAQVLEHHLAGSEQIETRLLLTAGTHHAAGLLLQRTPDRAEPDPDAWRRLALLGATATARELAELAPTELLRRLFPEDDVRLYAGRPLAFGCSCSAERVEAMLRMLGRDEVGAVLVERGVVEITCEFCNRRYALDAQACAALFTGASP